MIEIRLLSYFLAIAREQSITKAADALHITQPTLSKQMMELEAQKTAAHTRKEKDNAYRRRRLSAKQGAGNDKFDGKDRIGISHGRGADQR